MITLNEKKTLRHALLNYYTKDSINQIAKVCKLTPNGTYKILKKFEQEGILKFDKISNIKVYYPDFMNNKTKSVMQLALMPDALSSKIRSRLNDLEQLKNIALACAFFGSYARNSTVPNDLDVFFLVEEKNYKAYKKLLRNIQEITPVKIHDIVQTKEDIVKNIKNKDKVLFEILTNSIFLWGYAEIIEVLSNVSQ
jgi:DNA-binding Lrp family transcriptional regulator